MTAIALDPLIKEAKHRARRRRLLLAVATLAVALASAVAYTQLSTNSATGLAACRPGDYAMRIGAGPATEHFVGAVTFTAQGAPCRLRATVKMALLNRQGAVTPMRGNPATWSIARTVSRSHEPLIPFAYGPWCGNPSLTLVARVVGGPFSRYSTPATPRCSADLASLPHEFARFDNDG